MKAKLELAVVLCCITAAASAHGGRTNASGCHNERATGGYHCHPLPVVAAGTHSGFDQARRNHSYASCAAARAAGAAPLRRGEPGYSTRLDRDRDGVACE